jgi:hypothetical protein
MSYIFSASVYCLMHTTFEQKILFYHFLSQIEYLVLDGNVLLSVRLRPSGGLRYVLDRLLHTQTLLRSVGVACRYDNRPQLTSLAVRISYMSVLVVVYYFRSDIGTSTFVTYSLYYVLGWTMVTTSRGQFTLLLSYLRTRFGILERNLRFVPII